MPWHAQFEWRSMKWQLWFSPVGRQEFRNIQNVLQEIAGGRPTWTKDNSDSSSRFGRCSDACAWVLLGPPGSSWVILGPCCLWQSPWFISRGLAAVSLVHLGASQLTFILRLWAWDCLFLGFWPSLKQGHFLEFFNIHINIHKYPLHRWGMWTFFRTFNWRSPYDNHCIPMYFPHDFPGIQKYPQFLTFTNPSLRVVSSLRS